MTNGDSRKDPFSTLILLNCVPELRLRHRSNNDPERLDRYFGGFVESLVLLVGASIVFETSGLVQLRRRTGHVVMVTVPGKHPDFKANLVVMLSMFLLRHQDLTFA